MLSIFVYLYNNFHHPQSFPDTLVLAQRLAEVGFDDEEIVTALDWLSESKQLKWSPYSDASPHAFRLYTQQEQALLGVEVIGKIENLIANGVLNPEQRELLIEQAFAIGEMPLSTENFQAILLMLLWADSREHAASEVLTAESKTSLVKVLH